MQTAWSAMQTAWSPMHPDLLDQEAFVILFCQAHIACMHGARMHSSALRLLTRSQALLHSQYFAYSSSLFIHYMQCFHCSLLPPGGITL